MSSKGDGNCVESVFGDRGYLTANVTVCIQ